MARRLTVKQAKLHASEFQALKDYLFKQIQRNSKKKFRKKKILAKFKLSKKTGQHRKKKQSLKGRNNKRIIQQGNEKTSKRASFLKRRLQARRRFQRKRRAYFGQTATGLYNNKGFSMMGSKKKSKQPTKTQRQKTREFLKKAGLHRTKAQRRAYQEALAKVLGYKPAKLSDVVAKPSRYTVKKRTVQYEVTKAVPGETVITGYRTNIWGEQVPIYEHGGQRPSISKPVGEKLIIKRLAKSGQGKGGGSGERGSHITGSAVARKAAAQRLGGTRGARPEREKKK